MGGFFFLFFGWWKCTGVWWLGWAHRHVPSSGLGGIHLMHWLCQLHQEIPSNIFYNFFSSKNKVIFFEDAYKSEDGHRTWETGRQFIIYLFIYFSPKKFALFSKLKFSVLNGVYNIYIYFKKLFSSSAYKYQIKTPFFNSLFSYPRERRAGDNLPSVSLSLSLSAPCEVTSGQPELTVKLREIKEPNFAELIYLGSIFILRKRMYADTGLMLPCFQNLCQEVQQLGDFCKSQRPGASSVPFLPSLLFSVYVSRVSVSTTKVHSLCVYLECWSFPDSWVGVLPKF